MPKGLITGLMSCALLVGGGYTAKAQAVSSAQQQAGTCTGQVVSNTGEEVIGATVRVKGTDKAAGTDLDGKFSLTGVKNGATLIISCIGYETKEVVWNGQPLTIELPESANALDEVVVVGYGVQKKANVTGSVSSMSAKQIASRPVSSVTAAMAGEMSGVTVIQNSGAPGSQTGSVTVRGKNTINAAEPLVIVDGVPGQMNNIAPEEIESVSVLKDAASAAIYGVQAANGVILITTKKGTKGQKTQISYSGNVAWARPVARLQHVDAYHHATMLNEALQNDGLATRYTDWQIQRWEQGINDATTPNTDWWGETFRTSQLETQHTISVNGGSEKTTYMV
ncbi:MAG: TonB-dependent receptor plug domain-containing protein, partial [Paramuribaculum sp.]|nr:TonB-dependent receptor plug domain-containing protein [Paramuribaculum sp.]